MESSILADVHIRPFHPCDNVHELTLLLNRAYQKLTTKGLRYLAATQNVATTQKRIEKGQCYVAIYNNQLIGTITYYPKNKGDRHPWYKQAFVAKYGQFAVEPSFQHIGLGVKLIQLVEELAARDGFKEITIDTAASATELINFYLKRSYRFIDFATWKETNYTSVLLSKSLTQ
jgi:GNAT superfamily N-acetyltransferase